MNGLNILQINMEHHPFPPSISNLSSSGSWFPLYPLIIKSLQTNKKIARTIDKSISQVHIKEIISLETTRSKLKPKQFGKIHLPHIGQLNTVSSNDLLIVTTCCKRLTAIYEMKMSYQHNQ